MGTPNKATAEIKALAQSYAPAAMMELARLATKAQSETARVAAIKELFDRGYGKATQLLAGDPEGAPLDTRVTVEVVSDLERAKAVASLIASAGRAD